MNPQRVISTRVTSMPMAFVANINLAGDTRAEVRDYSRYTMFLTPPTLRMRRQSN